MYSMKTQVLHKIGEKKIPDVSKCIQSLSLKGYIVISDSFY